MISSNNWTLRIFNSISWDHDGRYMGRLTGKRSRNVTKYINNWQHTGEQKNLFYGEEIESLCPAGYREHEHHLYYMVYLSLLMRTYHLQRRDAFREAHKKLCTTKAIFDLSRKLTAPARDIIPGIEEPIPITSSVYVVAREVWEEQWKIDLDQVLKGRLSKKWDRAQVIYYSDNPLTQHRKPMQ